FWRKGFGNHMAGKTGTAQVVRAQSAEQLYAKCEDKDYEFRHHALFVAFAPYDDPQIAVAALVEHGCHGSSAAGPIAERVISTYMKKYLPEQQKKYAKEELAFYHAFLKKRAAQRAKMEEEKEGDAPIESGEVSDE